MGQRPCLRTRRLRRAQIHPPLVLAGAGIGLAVGGLALAISFLSPAPDRPAAPDALAMLIDFPAPAPTAAPAAPSSALAAPAPAAAARPAPAVPPTAAPGPASVQPAAPRTPPAAVSAQPALPPAQPDDAGPRITETPPRPRLFDLDMVTGPDLTSPAYQRIAQAAQNGDPAQAIVQIEAFRTRHDASYQPALDSLIDTAADRLWWQRITELLTTRQQAVSQMHALRQSMARATADERQAIEQRLRTLQAQADAATRDLQDMRYIASQPPDLANPAMMHSLRQQRDPIIYERWRQRTIPTLIRTGGRPPWEMEMR